MAGGNVIRRPRSCVRVRKRRTNQRRSRSTYALETLLEEVSIALFASGTSLSDLHSRTRAAYVRAAASVARLHNGRTSVSGVAAYTGLPRATVRTILASPRLRSPRELTPIQRVIAGWQLDRRFNSRRLRLNGSKSFKRLSECYAGDIPYRAILRELVRIGLVEDLGSEVRMLKSRVGNQRQHYRLVGLLPSILAEFKHTS